MFQNMKKEMEREKIIQKKKLLEENENKILIQRHYKIIAENNQRNAQVRH